MTPQSQFVEACEALAQSFEDAGRSDIAALCDRAAYWLDGGNGLDALTLKELMSSCQDTLKEALKTTASAEAFIDRTTQEIADNLQMIEHTVTASAATGNTDDLLDRAAKLQAIAILTSNLFGE